jgi:hypothetical protein
MASTGVTGVLLALDGQPHPTGFIARVHASSALVLPVLVIIHVVGALFSSALEGQNLVLGMVTGWKRAPTELVEPEPPLAARLAGFLAASLAALLVATWLWRLLPAR